MSGEAMNERKQLIIETAMKLFAHKGYHSTSIQEIAEKSGISKGSVYTYFSSKEELMLSIFKYYYELVSEKILSIEQDKTLTAKEALAKQIMLQFTEFAAHREFIHMHMGEKSVLMREDLRNFIFKIRAEGLSWYCRRLIEVYGEAVSPFALDCATMLNGIISEYFFYIIFDKEELDFEKLASFIVRRLDGIMGSLSESEQPILNKDMLKPYMEPAKQPEHVQALKLIFNIKEKIKQSGYEQKKRQQIHSALETLEQEFKNEEGPREYIVEGLLLYLKNQEVPEVKEELDSLGKLVSS
jgi:AcrR family transcriptional regulator